MSRKADPNLKNKIIEQADELFCHYGFTKTTIDDIAKACGIAKGSIYNHFSSKEGIFAKVIHTRAANILAYIQTHVNDFDRVEDKLRFVISHRIKQIQNFINSAIHAKDLVRLPVVSDQKKCKDFRPPISIINAFSDLVQQVLEEGIKKGVFVEHDAKLMALQLNMVSTVFLPPYKLPEDARNQQLDIYIESMIKSLKYNPISPGESCEY